MGRKILAISIFAIILLNQSGYPLGLGLGGPHTPTGLPDISIPAGFNLNLELNLSLEKEKPITPVIFPSLRQAKASFLACRRSF